MDDPTTERLLAELPSAYDLDPADVDKAVRACGACADACLGYAVGLEARGAWGRDACAEATAYCAEACAGVVVVLVERSRAAPLLVPAVLRVGAEAARDWRSDCAGAPGPDHDRCAETTRRAERACTRLLRALGDAAA